MNKTKNPEKNKEKLLRTILNRKKTVYVGDGKFRLLTIARKIYEQNAFPDPYTLVEMGGVDSKEIVETGNKVIRDLSTNFDIRQSRPPHCSFFTERTFDGGVMRVSPLHYANQYRDERITEQELLNWGKELDRYEMLNWDIDLAFRQSMAQIELDSYFGHHLKEDELLKMYEEGKMEIVQKILNKWMNVNERKKITENANKIELNDLNYLCNGRCYKELIGENKGGTHECKFWG